MSSSSNHAQSVDKAIIMAIKVENNQSDRIDVDKPLWDQSTFMGRFRHFAFITDPTSCMTSEEDLDKAKKLVEQYRFVLFSF